MTYKFGFIYFVAAINVILSIRIPPNPCPDILKYYKNSQGRLYGEVRLPNDASTELLFNINASFSGNFNNPKLKLEMITTIEELNDYAPEVVFNVYFPYENVIPRITAIHLNGILYCSGPPEPIIINESGITSVWSQFSFSFNRGSPGSYNAASALEPGTSDNDIPIKNPSKLFYQQPLTTGTSTTKTLPQYVTQLIPPVKELSIYTTKKTIQTSEIPLLKINLHPVQNPLFKDDHNYTKTALFYQQPLTTTTSTTTLPHYMRHRIPPVEELSTYLTKKPIETSGIPPLEISLDPEQISLSEDDQKYTKIALYINKTLTINVQHIDKEGNKVPLKV